MNDKEKSLPIVVIFGRTNVGKSTLFNRFLGKEKALVSKIEGTTRDVNRAKIEWRKKTFELIDTGGITDIAYLSTTKGAKPEMIDAKVQRQAREMLKRADLILFVVDAIAGPLAQDRQMILYIKKTFAGKKNIILVVNKMDGQKIKREVSEFHKLALGEPVLISAATGSGTGDLLDVVIKKIKTFKSQISNLKSQISNPINVCIIGKPNVGKSSLLNKILGEERVIVSPIPHTTREPRDTIIDYEGRTIKLIDTAGISRKGQQSAYGKKEKKEALEKMGIAKSLRVLNRADIALLVIDISQPISHQETKIIDEIVSRRISLIIIANKWDLVGERDTVKFTDYIYDKLPYIKWAPLQFISARTGEKVNKIMNIIIKVKEARGIEINDAALKDFLLRIVKMHLPSKGKGLKKPRVYEMKQTKADPPQFNIRIGSKEDLHFSYVRFIENRLREKYGFYGTPIKINVVKNRAVHGKHNY